jgi:hypothetical protein
MFGASRALRAGFFLTRKITGPWELPPRSTPALPVAVLERQTRWLLHRIVEDIDMRRLDRRLTALADEHPRRTAVLTGLAAGLLAAPLALLLGRLLFREWAWGLVINAAVVATFAAGFSTYTRAVWRRQDRERLERRRQR